MKNVGNITIHTPEKDFEMVSKVLVRDKEIDPTTLGVFIKVCVLGKDWNLNIKGLSTHLNISEDKTRKSIGILESKGYITRTSVRDEKSGRLQGYNYDFFATPINEEERTHAGLAQNRVGQKQGTRITGNPETGEPNNNILNERIYNDGYIDFKEKKENTPKGVSKKEGQSDWRKDFEVYRSLVNEAHQLLANDEKFKAEIEMLHPGIDYHLSLKNSIDCYWGTDTGWDNKKTKSRGKKIDMVATLKTSMRNGYNKINKQRSTFQTDARFISFCNMYGGNGDKERAFAEWGKMTDEERITAEIHAKQYVVYTEERYRPKIDNYLHNCVYNKPVYHQTVMVFDPEDALEIAKRGYIPVMGSYNVLWNKERKVFLKIGTWDNIVFDGYNDNDRPSCARVQCQGIVYSWDTEAMKWIDERKLNRQ